MNVAYNIDCMEFMKTLPDKAFDLAVVDPPYGIGITHTHTAHGSELQSRSEVRQLFTAKQKAALSKQRFILRSMIAPHRTKGILGSCYG